MAARLGDVLYWLGCVVATATGGLAAYALTFPGGEPSVIAIIAGSIWLLGRACRYVLAGR
jgi:hypothetical protein